MSSLPPLRSNGVFSVFASCSIDAPLEEVWSILLDFPSYNKWNPFVRSQSVVNASKEILADQTLCEGSFLHLNVNLPPTMEEPGLFGRTSVFVKVTNIDHTNHRAAWSAEGLPKFLLRTERWQSLSVDEASGRTKYETIEVFGGFLAYFVKFFVGEKLVLGFQASADCLKKCAEELSPL